MTTDIIDTKAIVVAEEMAPANLYGTPNPEEIISRAVAQANVLSKVINDRQLFKVIGGKKHVVIEGWTTCGALVGVFAVPVWTRPLEDGWEARVEARTLSGQIVGAAEAECLRAEKNWSDRDDFALRSMAQTRAASKALRLPLGWIVTLAGFEATPGEELDGDTSRAAQRPNPAAAARTQQRPAPQNGQQRTAGPATPASDGPPTESQSKAIHALLAKVGRLDQKLHDKVVAAATIESPAFVGEDGKPHTSALTFRSASALIGVLNKAIAEAQQAVTVGPDDLPFE